MSPLRCIAAVYTYIFLQKKSIQKIFYPNNNILIRFGALPLRQEQES